MDVYILDTGINYNHIVFNGRASFGGYDAINDGRNGDDCQGHGTHCAGLAVGRLTGVAYGARVYRCVAVGKRINCQALMKTSSMIAMYYSFTASGF